MKKLITLMAALCVCAHLAAIPAKPVKRTVQQSDGTTLTIMLHGDENYHFYTTLDGVPVVENADGSFCYATVQNGRLTASTMLAHNQGARVATEVNFISNQSAQLRQQIGVTWGEKMQARNAHRVKRNNARRAKALGDPQKNKIVGNKKGLVILVNFKDKAMVRSKNEFYQQFNQTGYNKNKHIGSVRDYFLAQSYNQLTIDFDVVGPYTLNNNMAYYGQNDSQGNDLRPHEMVVEACKAANAEVNFKDYDWDGDGVVEQVYIIYAGYGESSGAPANTIWPHEYTISEGYSYAGSSSYNNGLTLDNVTLNTYACSNELMNTSGTTMDGIGTACHEFSHCLGLPDYYDTSYSGNYGMGSWSLMDGGSYNGPTGYEGNVPAGYTSYCRAFAGWIDLIELNEGQDIINMPAIINDKVAYIVYNEGNKNEYYLLENRQQQSYDKYLPGHGMLVIHVDYDPNVWSYNEVNTTGYGTYTNNNHQRLTVIPANNNTKTESGIPYPGTKKNTSLTNTSTPAATLYNKNKDGKKYMNKPIENIKEANGLISFTFNGGETVNVDTPVATDATDITSNSFTANWNAVEGATSYSLEITETKKPNQSSVLLEEDFSGFDVITSTGTDVSNDLDKYTQQPGWSGMKIYGGKAANSFGIKIGTSQIPGSIKSPVLDCPSSGKAAITFKAAPWNENTKAIYTLTIIGESGKQFFTKQITTTQEEELSFDVSDITEPFTINFTTQTGGLRMFLGNLVINNGDSNTAAGAPLRASKRTIDGITTNSYTLTDLSGEKYTYRVKAFIDDASSDWSNTITVEMPVIVDAIENVNINGDTFVEIYNISGVLLRRTTAASWQDTLPRGTYILKSANGTRKVYK